jgi:uncharacterized protein (TIGR03382 family)
MMKNSMWFVLFTAMLATTAVAQGEGEGEVAEPCGDITLEGECQGNVAVFCGNDDTLARIDCGNFAFGDNQTQAGTCEFYDNWGSWCAFDDGAACGFTLSGGGTQNFACSSPESGCFAGVCAPNKGVCTPDGEDTPPACSGNSLATCAPWAQRIEQLNCNGQINEAGDLLGATCEGGVCEDAPVGGPCATGVVECEAGATCVGATAQAPGECTAGGTNGGEGEGEGGGNGGGGNGGGNDDPEPTPATCSGNHPARGAPAAFAAAAVAVVAMLRRRRQ